MNSDLSERKEEKKAKMPFLGRTLGRGPTKSKKKLTSVSFAFTHTYTLEKLTLLLFPPSVHGKFSAGISPENW